MQLRFTSYIGIFFILVLLSSSGCGRAGSRQAAAQSPTIDQQAPNAPQIGKQPALPQQSFGLQNPSLQDALPDRLVMPTIDVDVPVVELGWRTNQSASGSILSEWDVAEYAAGWHKNSALPGSSEINGGNVVMSGHNNVLGSVFRELDQLKRNDEITVWSGNHAFVYTIDKVMIVPEKYATPEQRRANAAWMGSFDDSRLTLVSCWPRDDNTHRIIVVAHPVES